MTLHLAQLNIARLVAPLDSPALADFVAAQPRINALAEASPGFVWRLQDEDSGDATGFRPYGAEVIVNLTVWESIEALRGYAFHSGHLEIMRRRREWFEPFGAPYAVLWWVPAGHRPTLDEAAARLELLRTAGPGTEAFTLREPVPAGGQGH